MEQIIPRYFKLKYFSYLFYLGELKALNNLVVKMEKLFNNYKSILYKIEAIETYKDNIGSKM